MLIKERICFSHFDWTSFKIRTFLNPLSYGQGSFISKSVDILCDKFSLSNGSEPIFLWHYKHLDVLSWKLHFNGPQFYQVCIIIPIVLLFPTCVPVVLWSNVLIPGEQNMFENSVNNILIKTMQFFFDHRKLNWCGQ